METWKINIEGVKIVTERLVLRPFEEHDLNDLFEYARVAGVGESAGWKHHEDIEESNEILNRFIEGKHDFAIVLKDCGKVIGSLGIKESEEIYLKFFAKDGCCEIGYVLSKDYWGNGFMTEAVRATLAYI